MAGREVALVDVVTVVAIAREAFVTCAVVAAVIICTGGVYVTWCGGTFIDVGTFETGTALSGITGAAEGSDSVAAGGVTVTGSIAAFVDIFAGELGAYVSLGTYKGASFFVVDYEVV